MCGSGQPCIYAIYNAGGGGRFRIPYCSVQIIAGTYTVILFTHTVFL